MPADRFFLDTPSLIISGDEFHHLKKVMRAKVGDTLEVVNGRGELIQARITSLDTSAHLTVIHRQQAPPPTPLILAQAFLRHLDWVIEKGTELGATAFWLFPGDQSEKKNISMERLRALAISALKQCGRLYLPEIVLKPPLVSWQTPPGTLLFGDLSPDAPKIAQGAPLTIFIGPERGFSSRELEILQRFNAKGVKLHDNILRAETAVIAALSQVYIL